MDRIELRGMSFQGRHGVRDKERDQPQEFKVDIRIDADLTDAGLSDRLADTIDYTEVRSAAREVIEGESKKLLESLASAIAERILTMPRVEAVSVRVAKRPPSMQPIDAAAVRINRINRTRA
jgi:dihydroneopterin aldolase